MTSLELHLDRLLPAAERPADRRGGWPTGAPPTEYTRTPAARRVARLAAASGLFQFHFEHRHHLPLPQAWVPEGAHDLAEPPEWDRGILTERKYQSFRHDLPIGSFHPHHRAKWATHELCHGLVGFAWYVDAPPLFHATAARLTSRRDATTLAPPHF